MIRGKNEAPALSSSAALFMRVIGTLSILMVWCATCLTAELPNATWPMLAHDAARSGATAAEIRPPFARKWYRLFPDEGLMCGVQPVVANGCVYVGTLAGSVYAIDAESGRDRWAFRAPGAVLHSCAADGGKVFFGCADGRMYALRTSDGSLAWTVPTGAAVWNAPAVHAGTVFVGSRDGRLYAIRAEDGTVRWTAPTDGPLLCSPAVDANAGRVYIGSEDMHVYAFALHDGQRIWRSEKLPGVSMRGYHPVVAPDGAVLVTVTPAASLDRMASVLLEMVKEVIGDFASWRHSKEENARLREANFELLKQPDTYRRQREYLCLRLQEEPSLQTFFVLEPATGKQRFVTPIVYSESMNGTGAPPVVAPDGRVIVKFQALLRSRYDHYSPFLNVGYLDTATGDITPSMDQSRTYGWHDSLLLVHDEQCQLSVAGRVLINTHQDNVNAMDLDTLRGYGEPFCRSIHEPQPGEAVGIWTHVLRGTPLPVGKEWLARGTAVYGGGSVIDVPVSVAGNSLYFVPTHEINAGAALIAYRMQTDERSHDAALPPSDKLTEAEWQSVQQRPWDWDTLGMPRLDHVLKDLPGAVPGTRQQPLTEEAARAVAKITDAELDRFIWEAASAVRGSAPVVRGSPGPAPVTTDRSPESGRLTLDGFGEVGRPAPNAIQATDATLDQALTRGVHELIQHAWRPLVFPSGKHPEEAYRFFSDPTEMLYTLARAYPHVDTDLQQAIRQFVAGWSADDGPLATPIGRRILPADKGEIRSAYDVPEQLLRVADDFGRSELARLYPLWLWARTSGDWSKLERDWPELRSLVDRPPNAMEEDCRNGQVAGLIAYCRIAHHVQDQDAVQRGLTAARQAFRERLEYEFAYTHGGVITRVPVGRSIFGRLLQTYAAPTHRHLMDVYVDYHRPTWWLAWNVELMLRNESPFSLPTMSAEIFAARALILREPREKLAAYLDLPWCRADLFYLQKLAACLEASDKPTWEDVR